MDNKNQNKEIAALTLLIKENFRVFVSEVFGFDNAQFHNELDDMLSNGLNRKLCIALPRGFGKSTHISIIYPLWEIAKNHNVRILLVSSTADVTKSFMSEAISNIERNQKYQLWAKAIDPNGKGVIPRLRMRHRREENWSMDSIVIDRDDLKLKDPTINAVGLFGSILSKRADIIICDDIVNQENSMNEDQRKKIKDWVYSTLMPVLVPGGRFIYLGNTWHLDDIISNLLRDPQFDIRKRTPSILHEATRQDLWEQWANFHLDESLPPEEKKAKAEAFYRAHQTEMDQGIETLWPEKFSYAELYLQRIANPYSFARMYQCDPSIRPDQKFLEADIEKALHKGRDLVLQDEPRKGLEIECTASGLDLAISQKSYGDDTVLLSLDRVKTGAGDIRAGDYIIRNIERGKFHPNEVRKRVIRHDEVVEPIGIRVETTAYQEAMYLDLEDSGIPVRSYHTGREKNDPDIGVNSLAILLAQGKLVLPNSNKDARTRRLVTQLINEMRAYPEGHTGDSLMALWFAYSEIRDYTKSKYTVPSILGAENIPQSGKQIDMNDPEQRKPEEKKADLAIMQEKEYERRNFNRMMGKGWW